jgi:protein-S-isoprenylcysteine O-methyltransferase Ste14
MRHFVDMAGWWLCIVYASIPAFWFTIHPFTEFWRSRKSSPYRVLLPAWILMWIILALCTFRWRGLLFYESSWCWIPGVIFLVAGLWLYVKSTRKFTGRQVSGMAEVLPQPGEQRLVITGIRTRIRHPMYLGHFCEMLAWSIGTGVVACYGLTLFAVITGIIMVRMEDNELEARFGGDYRTYRQMVPAFLPKF